MEKYSWDPAPHGVISITYLGEEIGQADSVTKALTIETSHRTERKNEAHNLYSQHRQQV